MACTYLSHPTALPGGGHHYVHARTRQMPKWPSATLETWVLAFCCHSASTGKVKARRDQPAQCPRRGLTISPSLQPQASDDEELRGSDSLQDQLWLVFMQWEKPERPTTRLSDPEDVFGAMLQMPNNQQFRLPRGSHISVDSPPQPPSLDPAFQPLVYTGASLGSGSPRGSLCHQPIPWAARGTAEVWKGP